MTKFHQRRQRRGSAAMEFGLWVTPLILMLSGIIDISWYLSLKENVMRAARDGARDGAATPDLDRADAIDEVGDAAAATAQAVLDNLGYTCPNAVSVAQTPLVFNGTDLLKLDVSVECDFTPLLGMLPLFGSGSPLEKVKGGFIMLSDTL